MAFFPPCWNQHFHGCTRKLGQHTASFCWDPCCGCQQWGWDVERTHLPLGLDRALPLSSHTSMQASLTRAVLCWKHGKGIEGTEGQIILHLHALGFGTFFWSIWRQPLSETRHHGPWSCDIPVAPVGTFSTSLLQTQIMDCPNLG